MDPLLETKIRVPTAHASRISRPRIREHLGSATGAALTLVSAPAGFGKTTAVTEWLEASATPTRRVAWVSLDAGDDDPGRFWAYVVASLRTALGDEADVRWPEPAAPADVVITALLNELLVLDADVVLVLDDYHLISNPAIHDGVGRFVDHLPPRVRLILLGRADPPLALARRRVSGRMVELRAADLRFTEEETETYLARVGAALSRADAAVLAERTEGWAAALQLAALSMRDRDDRSSFVAAFAGDDRYLLDYLAEEVLDRQPAPVREFLLRTSILDRLTGPLCDAVTGQVGGAAELERLERANMFLVPLDERRRWYRYHHLFADVLQAHLAAEPAGTVVALHCRASEWHAAHGAPADAIRHALAAGDVERAADLAEVAIPAWRRAREEVTIRHWLQLLPRDELRRRPVLMIGLIGARASIGEFPADTDELLDEAEVLMGRTSVVGDPAQLPAVPAAIEMYRAARSLTRGDLVGTRTHGRRALETAPADDHLVRSAAGGLVGLAAWYAGEIDAAYDGFATSVEGLRREGHLADVLGCTIILADLRVAQGRLRDAHRLYADGLALGTSTVGVPLRGTADMHVGLADIHRERGQLAAAREHLQRSAALGASNGLPQHPYRSKLVEARLCAAEGDLVAARALLDDAERVYTTDFLPGVRPIPAMRAALHAQHGHLDDALAWADARGLRAHDELTYVGELEHVVLARVLVARGRVARDPSAVDEAIGLLTRVADAATAAGRAGDLLPVLVLLALTEDARGNHAAALAHLDRALRAAEPEGYVRVFLDEGPRLQSLLEAAVASRGPTAFVHGLLGAGPAAVHATPDAARLVDPLSGRELDVLRLLATDLTGPEIARELSVSLNTVRTHTKRIYTKLGVTNRRAAVRAAAERRVVPGT